jgi:LuxR family maltose regulon positive regulatory protein
MGRMADSAALENNLFASKLFRPALPAALVARQGLVTRLQEGLALGRTLTLISAPAGYGKSTLAAEWLAQVRQPIAWLSLDESDDDPLRFFTYLCAALQQINIPLSSELLKALNAGQLPPQNILSSALVNALQAATSTCLCVLDDFQTIQDKLILSVIQDLVAHPPRHLRLILISREDPTLPLARLRARNQLTEIRAADLRFSDAEIERLLRQGLGLNLSNQELARLAERTEGWIAGLQLAALAMQSQATSDGPASLGDFIDNLSGAHRFFLGYLTEEVLKAQPPAVQDFLLQTSILAKLNGDLCDAVTEGLGSAARLEELLAANLFLIPLDDEGRWYRYHHLFADLLRNLLRRARSFEIPELHRRASRWHEAHNLPIEAIDHALAAEDFSRVAELLETQSWDMLNHGLVRKIETWIHALPEEQRYHSPRIALDFAWMHLLRGNFGQIPPYLQHAQVALTRLDANEPSRQNLQAELLALQSNLLQVQGNHSASLQSAQAALQLVVPENLRVVGLASLGMGAAYRQAGNFEQAVSALQKAVQASQASGELVTEMLAVAHLTLMAMQFGRLRFAAQTAASSIERIQNSGISPPPIIGAVYGALGLVYYEWNQMDQARQYFLQGIHLGTFSGHNASLIYTKANLARLLQAEGNLDQATRQVSQSVELLSQGAPGWVGPELVARQVSLLLAQANPDAAHALLLRSGITMDTPIHHQTDPLHLAWLRWLVAQKRPQALDLAGRIIQSAQEGQRHGTLLQAWILSALGQAGAPQTALPMLEQALALAEPEGYQRIFLDEGAPIATLLQRLSHIPYAQKLLAFIPELANQPQRVALIEPLTEREIEVLGLMAQGLKYAEIADQLVVSVNTVRFHIKGIYRKLGVNKQSQALQLARQLNLL